MTAAEWQALWDAQNGACYLCAGPLSDNRNDIAVDHDHSCCGRNKSCRFCRRGMACDACNLAVGLLRDDPELVRRIADNLERASRAARERINAKPEQIALV